MMSYTRTSSSTMLHGGAAFPPPPHLAYMQTNGNGIGGGGGGSGGLVNGVCGAAPPTLSLSSSHGHAANGGQAKCECQECTYCMRRLDSLSIKCCECLDFHLCLKCFSMSAEIGEHKKDHNYCIISKMSFPLFDSEKPWTYKEELLLLQFIEQYGFGNWEEIAKHLPARTAEECLQHYNSYYIYGNLGKYTFNANSRNILMSNGTHAGVKTNPYNETPWYTPCKSSSGAGSGHQLKAQSLLPASSMSSPSETVLLPPVEMSSEEQRALGYMPLRDDYERDYKNDCESLLSNLAIAHNQLFLLNHHSDALASALANGNGATNGHCHSNGLESKLSASYPSALCNLNANLLRSPTVNSSASASNAVADVDDVIDYELKLTLIKMYCDCLNERQRFKLVAREYGLVNNASSLINSHAIALINGAYGLTDPKYITSLNNGTLSNGGPGRKKKNPTKQVRELDEDNERFKKFAQLMSASEFEALLVNVKRHRNLTKRLHELMHRTSNKNGTKSPHRTKIKREEETHSSTPQLVKPARKKKFSFKPSTPSKQSPAKRFKRDQSPTTYKLNDSYFQKLKQEFKSEPGVSAEPVSASVRKSTSSRASSRSSSVGSQISVASESNSTDSNSKSTSTTATTSDSTSKSTSSHARRYKIANKQKFLDYEEEEEEANGEASSDDELNSDVDGESEQESSGRNGHDDNLSTTTTNTNTTGATADDDASSMNSSTNGIARRLRGSTSTSKVRGDSNHKSPRKENGSSKAARRVATRSARKSQSSETKPSRSQSSRSKARLRRKLRRLVYNDEEEENGDGSTNMDTDSDETAQNSSSGEEGSDTEDEDEEASDDDEDEEEEEENDDDQSSTATNDQESVSNGGRKLTRSNSKLATANHARDGKRSRSSPSKEAKSRRAGGRLCSMPGYNLLSENEKKQLKQFA